MLDRGSGSCTAYNSRDLHRPTQRASVKPFTSSETQCERVTNNSTFHIHNGSGRERPSPQKKFHFHSLKYYKSYNRKASSVPNLQPMGQIFSARSSLKRKREPESEHQNEARKALVVEDPNKDVQSNSTARTTVSSMATPTVQSSFESRWDHDVFLSFRGEVTRKNFTDHLYSALKRVRIIPSKMMRSFVEGRTSLPNYSMRFVDQEFPL